MEHGHDFFEIFLIVEGGGWHRVNETRIPLAEGDLVFIRPRDIHCFIAGPAGGMSLANVAFPAGWFGRFRSLHPDEKGLEPWLLPELPPMTSLSPAERISLDQILFALAPANGPRHLLLIRFCLEAFAMLEAKGSSPGRASLPPWLKKCVEAMEAPENIRREIGWFQGLAGRSPEHLARLCRRHFGVPPTELLNRSRIRHAQRMLLQGDGKVIEVAYDCGFENLGYFHRVFRRLSGCTPRHWRLRHPAITVPRAR